MKTFKNFLFEDSGLENGQAPYELDDADVVARVNAVLGHVAVSEYMNPQAAVEQMKSKLSQIGLNPVSNEDMEFSESGEFDLNFSRYGEIIGKSVDTPYDEMEKEEKIVSLKVKYEMLETVTPVPNNTFCTKLLALLDVVISWPIETSGAKRSDMSIIFFNSNS